MGAVFGSTCLGCEFVADGGPLHMAEQRVQKATAVHKGLGAGVWGCSEGCSVKGAMELAEGRGLAQPVGGLG